MNEKRVICKNCKYYKKKESPFDFEIGDCRRYPEAKDVQKDDWCGEWKKKSK